MQLSLADLNKRIARDVSADIELVRGEGYHYLVFDDGKRYESKSIMVPYLSQMSNKRWIAEAREFLNEVEPREVEVRHIGDFSYEKVIGAATPEHARLADKLLETLLFQANQYKSPEHSPTVVKQFDIESNGSGLTFVVVELGLEGDEGTLASVLCRNHRHISISGHGRRIRWSLLNSKLKKDSRGYWNCLHAITK